jgi:hypothetical protein
MRTTSPKGANAEASISVAVTANGALNSSLRRTVQPASWCQGLNEGVRIQRFGQLGELPMNCDNRRNLFPSVVVIVRLPALT